MERKTTYDVITEWLRAKMGTAATVDVRSTDVETDLRTFAIIRYGKRHSPSTWSRRWREFKNDPALMGQANVAEITEVPSDSRQTTWRVVACSTSLPA